MILIFCDAALVVLRKGSWRYRRYLGHSAVHFIQKLVAQLFPEHALQGPPAPRKEQPRSRFPEGKASKRSPSSACPNEALRSSSSNTFRNNSSMVSMFDPLVRGYASRPRQSAKPCDQCERALPKRSSLDEQTTALAQRKTTRKPLQPKAKELVRTDISRETSVRRAASAEDLRPTASPRRIAASLASGAPAARPSSRSPPPRTARSCRCARARRAPHVPGRRSTAPPCAPR